MTQSLVDLEKTHRREEGTHYTAGLPATPGAAPIFNRNPQVNHHIFEPSPSEGHAIMRLRWWRTNRPDVTATLIYRTQYVTCTDWTRTEPQP